MLRRLQSLRESPAAAHVLPLVVFTAFLVIPDWFQVKNPELPWYQHAPEHWVYPLQTLVCAAVLFCFRQHYQLAPWRSLWLAALFAVIGIALWITPAWVYTKLAPGDSAPEWWSWLGLVERKEGFDPTVLAAWPAWEKAAICMRFVRMVVIVPLVEELMWRGFLMRYVNAGEADWRSVPFGTHTWIGFWIVSLAVTLVHSPEDYFTAFLWAALTYVLAVRSRSLGACVIMHAMGNLLLGLYALKTQQWGFW
jgi:uncharacterized protein